MNPHAICTCLSLIVVLAMTREDRFSISALTMTASPGTTPLRAICSLAEMGPVLQHRQHRNLSLELSSGNCHVKKKEKKRKEKKREEDESFVLQRAWRTDIKI